MGLKSAVWMVGEEGVIAFVGEDSTFLCAAIQAEMCYVSNTAFNQLQASPPQRHHFSGCARPWRYFELT